jgi:hypothetical protein
MNRILISMLLALCVGSAYAQSDTTNAAAGSKAKADAPMTAEQKSAESFCLRQTGSHLRSISAKPHNERAVECANAPGRVYTREDLERTGAFTTRDALRSADPSVH